MKIIYALVILAIFQGCSTYKSYLPSSRDAAENPYVIVATGEDKAIFETKRGLMWGGYEPGLMAVDPEIVQVVYRENDRGHSAYIRGIKPGRSIVYYVNRFGAGAENSDPANRAYWLQRLGESRDYLTVEVK